MNTNSDVGNMTAHPCLVWSGVVQDGTATLCTTTAAAISSLGSIFYYVVCGMVFSRVGRGIFKG